MSGGTRRLSAAMLVFLTSLVAPAVAEESRPFPPPPESWPETIDDTPIINFILLDRIEHQAADVSDVRLWDAQGWVGGDWNKLWWKTEGEHIAGAELEEASVEALYARRIAPFWHLQAGVRYELEPRPSRSSAALGIQGLGLYWFELEAMAYLSEDGDLSARLEAEYDLPLTQRLVLQPRFETGVSANDVAELGIGQGFTDVALDLRLRYEIRRELAPYIGIAWQRKLGQTADFARRAGEDVDTLALVAGVRAWF